MLNRFVQARIVRIAENFLPARAVMPRKLVFYEEPFWEETVFFSFYSKDGGPSDPASCFVASSWHWYARYNHRRSVADFATIIAESEYRPSTSSVLLGAYEQSSEGRLPRLLEDTGDAEQVWEVHAESLHCEYFAQTSLGFIHYVWQSTA